MKIFARRPCSFIFYKKLPYNHF